MPKYVKELEGEVWACLDNVDDPELDEPITSMGFVESVEISREYGSVNIGFRLPTYWCSPNFAYLMASDMRSEIEKLDWVQTATIQLNDHCFADRINDGVNGDRNFDAVFSEYSNGEDLDAMRIKFQEKAYLRRQETLLIALEGLGYNHADIVKMSLGTFDSVEFSDSNAAKQKIRYRALLLSRALAADEGDFAFPMWNGQTINAENFKDYLSQCRAVRINMEFNGALCRGLKESRYKEIRIENNVAVPIQFIRNAGKAELH